MKEQIKKTPVQKMIEALKTPTIEYIWDGEKKNGRKKRGVLVASVVYGKVLIGFSICHKTLDRFDYIDGKHKPGCGLEWAIARAEKWMDWKKSFIVEPTKKKAGKKEVPIPSLMLDEIEDFIAKCLLLKRYQNKEFPGWAMDLLNGGDRNFEGVHDEVREVIDSMQTQLQP